MKFITFLKQMFTSHSGVSSKRVCGVIGWFVCLGVLIYCAINVIQAPLMIDTILLCCMGLLGCIWGILISPTIWGMTINAQYDKER